MTTLRSLTPADRPALLAFLANHRASSMFLLSNAAHSGIVDGDNPFHGAYAAAFDESNMIGVAAHYWNGNVMLQVGDQIELAADLVRAAVYASGRAIHGLIGDALQCEAAQCALRLSDEQFQLHESDGLYTLALDRLSIPAHATNARLATANDREILNAMYADFEIEALNETDVDAAREHAKKAVSMRIEHRMQYVLDINGDIVAASTFSAAAMSSVQIGGVWTPKHLRARGYARACIAGSLVLAKNDGFTEAVLSTGDDNVAAIKSYEAIGFQKIGRYFIGLLRDPVRLTATF